MKIFYMSGTRLPSQDSHPIHVMKMAQAFGKAGHDVTLFAQGSGAASEDLFEIYFSLNLKIRKKILNSYKLFSKTMEFCCKQ